MSTLLDAITTKTKPAAKKANGKKPAASAFATAKAGKAKRAAKAAATKPVKVKAKTKEKPMPAPTAPVFSVEALINELREIATISPSVAEIEALTILFQKAYDAGKNAPRARAPRAGGPSKSEQAAELLLRPEGCTTKDILDLTKWPSVSVPAVARANGLTLRQEKAGRVTTYFGARG